MQSFAAHTPFAHFHNYSPSQTQSRPVGEKTDGNSYGALDYKDSGHTLEGEINSTIASNSGNITIGGNKVSKEDLESQAINTNADAIHIITKDKDWNHDLTAELIDLGATKKQIEDIQNAYKSLTATVPDKIKAQGPNAEDIYRKAIANGLDGERLESFSNSKEFQASLKARNTYDRAIDKFGKESEIPAGIVKKILEGEEIFFEADGSAYIFVPCSSGLANCKRVIGNDSPSKEEVLDIIVKTWNDLENASTTEGYSTAQERFTIAMRCASNWVRKEGDKSLWGHVYARISDFNIDDKPWLRDNPDESSLKDNALGLGVGLRDAAAGGAYDTLLMVADSGTGFGSIAIPPGYFSTQEKKHFDNTYLEVLANNLDSGKFDSPEAAAKAAYKTTVMIVDPDSKLEEGSVFGVADPYVQEGYSRKVGADNDAEFWDAYFGGNAASGPWSLAAGELTGLGALASQRATAAKNLGVSTKQYNTILAKDDGRYLTLSNGRVFAHVGDDVLDISNLDKATQNKLSRQKQLRHVEGSREREAIKGNQGGYFNNFEDAEKIFGALADNNVQVLGKSGDNIVFRYDGVTAYNNNAGAGYVKQETNVYILKGSSSPSIVPINPNWRPK